MLSYLTINEIFVLFSHAWRLLFLCLFMYIIN
jgi:hypothetical protein